MTSELLKLLGQAADTSKSLRSRLEVNDQEREKFKADLTSLENQLQELHRRITALTPDESLQISNVPAHPEQYQPARPDRLEGGPAPVKQKG
jgi:predicted  nucleic acid-binding Zn-ribbon protein